MPGPLLAAALPAILGAVGQAGASAIGAGAAGVDRERQRAMLERILAEYGDIDIPTLQNLAAETLGPSAQESVRGQMDPRLRTEQMSTLDTLGDFAQDGDTASSKAAMHRILSGVARQESAGRNAILNNMRARGVSGSGAELAMQLDNQQDSADRAHTAGLEESAAAQRRMLEAAVQKGRFAGDVRKQDYGEMSDEATAKDMISKFNATSRDSTNRHNAQLPAQQFAMKMGVMNGKANAASGVASNYGQSADRAAQTGYGVGQAINQGANAVGGWLSDEEKKKKGL